MRPELDEALAWAKQRALEVRVLGGGSNVVVADAGFPGLVIDLALRGIRIRKLGSDVEIRAGAGEPWDDFVAAMVSRGYQGLECLSGIPGRVGGHTDSKCRRLRPRRGRDHLSGGDHRYNPEHAAHFLRRGVPVFLSRQLVQVARTGPLHRHRSHLSACIRTAVPAFAMPSSNDTCSRRATPPRHWQRCARPCSSCAGANRCCSTRAMPTVAAVARSS